MTPTPEATQPPTPSVPGEVTYAMVAGLFNKCTMCHGEGGQKGVDLRSYQSIMAGGDDGPIVIAGDPDNSLLVKVQSGSSPHFGQFTETELAQIIDWIKGGAKE